MKFIGHWLDRQELKEQAEARINWHQKLEQYRKPKVKNMTKAEALKKLMSLDYDTKEGCEYNLRMLEALGLIEFDKPKDEVERFKEQLYAAFSPGIETMLQGYGFKIVKDTA